jgi:hypothetical protein
LAVEPAGGARPDNSTLAGPPPAIAAAVAWLVTSPDADALQRRNIDAQPLAIERGFYPDWRSVAS